MQVTIYNLKAQTRAPQRRQYERTTHTDVAKCDIRYVDKLPMPAQKG